MGVKRIKNLPGAGKAIAFKPDVQCVDDIRMLRVAMSGLAGGIVPLTVSETIRASIRFAAIFTQRQLDAMTAGESKTA